MQGDTTLNYDNSTEESEQETSANMSYTTVTEHNTGLRNKAAEIHNILSNIHPVNMLLNNAIHWKQR